MASTGAFSFDLISIGADDAGGTHLIGEVAEVVVYTQALSSTDRASLYSYLNTKWSVAGGTTPVTATRSTTWNVAAAAVPKVSPGADTTAGTGTSTSSGTSLTVTHGVVDVGETLVVGVVADNVTNATLPTISSITKAAGETNNWVLIGSVDSSTATAGGGVRGMLYAITAKVRWAAATQTITLSTAITAKAAVSRTFYGVTTTARGTVPSGTTGAAGVSTAGTPTATTAGTALVTGDLVLGLAVTESTTIPGLDSDTLNGSWVGFSAGLATSGNATTAVALRPQYKIVTAAGAQTFNPTCNTDSGVCVVGLVPQVLTGVTTTRATSWGVRANVTASRATTWVTKFVVTATRATTWNVAAGGTTPAFYSDNFNRANGGVGPNWTTDSDAIGLTIFGNCIGQSGAGNTNGAAWTAGAATSSDMYVKANITISTAHFGNAPALWIRRANSGALEGYVVYFAAYGGSYRFDRIGAAGGGDTTLKNVAGAPIPAGTYAMEVRAIGNVISLWINGTMVDSVTDSGYNDSTHRTAGIRQYNDVPGYVATDDFEFGAYVASSGPVVINRGESRTNPPGTNGPMTLAHAAFTPAAGSLIVAMPGFQGQNTSASASVALSMADTFGDTGGTAWTLSASCNRGSVVNTQWTETADIWTRRIGTTPGSGVVTVTGAIGTVTSTTHAFWMQVAEVTGENTTTPIGATGSPSVGFTVTSFDVVLSVAPAADSVVFSNFSQDFSPSFQYTAPTGFTVLNDEYDIPSGWQQIFAAAYKVGSAPTTVTWSGLVATNRVLACAIEVKAAGAYTQPPVRTFNGSSDVIGFSSYGTASKLDWGTIAVIARNSGTGAGGGVITGVGGGNTFLGLHAYPDGGVACYWETPTPDYVTYPFLPSDGWCLLVLTKAAGSAPMNFRRIRLSDGNTSTATLASRNDNPWDYVLQFGTDLSGSFSGDIAGGAIWKGRVLTPTELAGLPANWNAWAALSPTWHWPLDQTSTATAVTDVTGHGANQTSITGTTVTLNAAPIGWAPLVSVTATRTTTWNVAVWAR